MVLDRKGTIAAASGACSSVLGLDNHELTGRNFYRELFSARTAKIELHADVQRARNGTRVQRDVRCKRPRLLATTDPLTRVLNRRSFMDKLRYEVTRARRYKEALSLMLIDIDDFKKFNDTYGHDVGDKVLTTFAGVTRGLLRESDSFGRLGGEEFAVLLPHTDLEEGQSVAERVRRAAEHATVSIHQGILRFTVSIGLAEANSAAPVAESLLKRADSTMYKAKRQGKNRIEVDACRHLRGGKVVKLHIG